MSDQSERRNHSNPFLEAYHQLLNKKIQEQLTESQRRFFSLLNAEHACGFFSVEQDGTSVSLLPQDVAIYISMIETPIPDNRGNGHAGRLLKKVCAVADQVQIVLRLKAEPKGLIGLREPELIEWYRRNGFTGETVDMIRPPAAPPRPAVSG